MPLNDAIRKLSLRRAFLVREISEIDARIRLLQSGRDVAAGGTARARIVAYLAGNPEEDFTPRELATALGIGEHTLRKALSDAVDALEIRRYGPARYRTNAG